MAGLLTSLFKRAADLVWPRVCAVEGCGRVSDRPDRHLCSSCLAALPFHEAGGACQCCGRLVMAEARHAFVCEDCQRHPPPYACARSAVLYREPVDALVKAFKDHQATWLCADLTDLLEGAVRGKLPFADIDVLVPVPLFPTQEHQRGYNQSALLAQELGRRLNRRADTASLIRTRDTVEQKSLSGEERRKNLEGAFAVPDPRFIRGRTVLLIDDVMTSGSTLTHCTLPLLAAGAAQVWCATVARAVMRS